MKFFSKYDTVRIAGYISQKRRNEKETFTGLLCDCQYQKNRYDESYWFMDVSLLISTKCYPHFQIRQAFLGQCKIQEWRIVLIEKKIKRFNND